MAELAIRGVRAHPVLPGLVQGQVMTADVRQALAELDAVYALQVLPEAQLLRGGSIQQLALQVVEQVQPLLIPGQIDGIDGPVAHLPGPSWGLHGLVPAQLKGNPQPPMQRRVTLIAQAVTERLRQTARIVLKQKVKSGRPQLLVQMLLTEPEALWLSIAPVLPLPPQQAWPCAYPAGLADVADDDLAPASSFRKLHEALACMGVTPQPGDSAVDLGACPGGWTRVLRQYGARVVAVDRSPLAAHLLADPQVEFKAGDAFAWRPAQSVQWLVSDIVAFPERIVELIAAWCGQSLCSNLVVQMKFKGEPNWPCLNAALAIARQHGYFARAKHFFNDKNEVTLMACRGGDGG